MAMRQCWKNKLEVRHSNTESPCGISEFFFKIMRCYYMVNKITLI